MGNVEGNPLKRLNVEWYHNQVISTCSWSDNGKNGVEDECQNGRASSVSLGQKVWVFRSCVSSSVVVVIMCIVCI